jgi:hypothetical protein
MIFRMFLISLALLASLSKEPPAIPTLALTTPGSPHTVKGRANHLFYSLQIL